MAKPPYIPARLVNAEKPLEVRWYIVFWVWDAGKQVMVRKRDYDINQKKTKSERLKFAKERIAAINALLEAGSHVDPKEKKKQDLQISIEKDKDYTVERAIAFILPVIKSTKRPDTYTSYSSVANLFLKFCELAGWDQWKIRTIDRDDIMTFLDYIQVTGTEALTDKKEGAKVSNTTRNNYKTALSAIFTLLVERKVLEKNVIHGIKELGEEVEGNVAYTPEQIEVLKHAIQVAEPRLWLFITFMFYGFMRPAEIARTQVKRINLEKGEIFLPGTITKNKKPRTLRISGAWMKYLRSLNLQDYSPEHYVFGHNLITGSNKLQKNHAGNLHRDIIRPLGFGAEYGLYPWKHTGVCMHYLAGMDIKTIQEQIGHQTLKETDIYLRSLNLYAKRNIDDKSPEI